MLTLVALPALASAAGHPHASARSSHHNSVVLRSSALSANAHRATLTLTLSARTRDHLFPLHAPERLVVDLAHTRRQSPLPHTDEDDLVSGIQAGAHAGGLRLVLALAGPVHYRVEESREGKATTLRIRLTAATAATAARSADSAPAEPVAVHATHAPPSGDREVIVAVDAGHGGVDPGATGPDGVHEKDVTLAIARDLAERINHTPGMHAFLTRHGDYFVTLRDRTRLAHAGHADLFVSIHADSAPDRHVTGASVYTLSERGASSEAARRLADEQNAADLKGGISLSSQPRPLRPVLLDLSQNAIMGQSGEAAQDVLAALDNVGQIRKHEVQHAAFVVLKSPDVPSMLVETAYISNRSDERRLARPAEQRRLAEAILHGIERYFRDFPPEGSLFARAHAVASSAS